MPRCPSCHRRLAGGTRCPDDGGIAPKSPQAPWRDLPTTPPRVPGYAVGAPLGVGGCAVVWRALRLHDRSEVALKIAHRDDFLATRRLEREAEALATIGPPHVPAHCETGRLTDGRVYVAMERLVGKTLAEILESLPAPPALRWVRRLSRGLVTILGAVHAANLVHRDLKPENIFLLSGHPLFETASPGPEAAPGRDVPGSTGIRLMDFGLLRTLLPETDPRLTAAGVVLGTVEYTAPEQLRPGTEVDERADIYALGIILYELLTLRPPFTGDRASIEHGHASLRPPKPRQFASVPEPVEDVILACLAKNPRKRPQSVSALGGDLAAAWRRARPQSISRLSAGHTALLVTKRQPVVLAAIDAQLAPETVEVAVKRLGGFVARQRSSRYVCVFSGLANEDPVQSAVAAARVLVEANPERARAALHLTSVALRRRRRGSPVVIGTALDKPETWLPRGQWTGVLLSPAVAQTQPGETTRPAADHSGYFRFAAEARPADPSVRLIGRKSIMGRAAASLRQCVASATPGLFTVLAGPGIGKSRLCAALWQKAQAQFPAAEVVAVRATRTSTGDGDATACITAALDSLDLNPDTSARLPGPASKKPVVIIVDDGHLADADTLSRIEYATLDHPEAALWIAVVALPRLQELRSRWGERAARHDLVDMGPLDDDDAMELAAELLRPVEYPPTAFLQRLVRWSGGSPHLLAGLVSELKRRGVVRRHEQGQGWHVATAELEELPPQAAGQWLATRMLDEMPPELAACVRVCAVLGANFAAGELAWVQDAVEEQGGAGTTVDTEVGLAQLVGRGTVRRAGDGDFSFASPAFQNAVYKLLAAKDRKTLHCYAAEHWRSQLGGGDDFSAANPVALERFARHAGPCGQVADAARAFVHLGNRARAGHRYVEADNFYTAALRFAENLPQVEMAALSGRGKVRYYLHRLREALGDLRRARAIAEDLNDVPAAVYLLLEEATAADFAAEFQVSARCARCADALLAAIEPVTSGELAVGNRSPAALRARCIAAFGRTAWRQGQVGKAIELLGRAFEAARLAGDDEGAMLAQLLLAPALVVAGRLDEAEPVFEEALALCAQLGDRRHECAALGNRMTLWSARKQTDRAEDDLRRVIQLAREIGNPAPERVATHNLAELLYWSGEHDEALKLARRSRTLQERFFGKIPEDALLLARIHAARAELGDARALLNWLKEECEPDESDPILEILYRAVRLAVSQMTGHTDRLVDRMTDNPDSDTWDELEARATGKVPTEELLEVLWWRSQAAVSAQRWDEARSSLATARTHLAEAPIWTRRLETLSKHLKRHYS